MIHYLPKENNPKRTIGFSIRISVKLSISYDYGAKDFNEF